MINGNFPQRTLNATFVNLDGKNYLTRYNVTYELSETSLSIWELCDGNHTEEDMAEALTKEYEVLYAQALADCREFVKDLTAKGFLQ